MDAIYCAPNAENLVPFPGMDKFSTPFFTLLRSWDTVSIYKPADAEVIPVWKDDSFSEGWSWYLDGSYGNCSLTIDNLLRMRVQAKNSNDAWMGLTQQLSNVSDATYLKMRYKIDVPSYVLELVFWDSEGGFLMIKYLPQSAEWSEASFRLPTDIGDASKMGLIVWSKDTTERICELDFIMLLKIVPKNMLGHD
jgi:hypothetical protein